MTVPAVWDVEVSCVDTKDLGSIPPSLPYSARLQHILVLKIWNKTYHSQSHYVIKFDLQQITRMIYLNKNQLASKPYSFLLPHFSLNRQHAAWFKCNVTNWNTGSNPYKPSDINWEEFCCHSIALSLFDTFSWTDILKLLWVSIASYIKTN